MDTLLIVGGLIVLVALAWLWKRRQAPGAASPQRGKSRSADGSDTLMHWHPQATRIMTTTERKAYAALRSGLPDHIILAQVPLARFLKVPTRHSYSEWLRRVGVMCADLVVCDGVSQVIAVVDIRAPESQENDRAKQRHARMDRVLKAAEIPLHIWREDALPNAVGARNAILKMPVEVPAGAAGVPAATHPGRATASPVPVRGTATAVTVEDDTSEQRDPPSSTWFDELDSSSVPLAPPMPPRGSGPSIR